MKETTIAVVRLCEVCGERATPTTRGTVVDWLAYCDAHRPTGKSDAAPAAGCAVGSIDTGRIGRERRQKESLTMDYDKAGYLAELLAEQFSAVLELREDLAALRAAAQQHIEEQRNRADAAERKAAELQRELKELEAFTHDRMSEITRLCKERDAVAAEAAQTERLAREEIKRLRAERDEAQNLAAQMERLAREAQAEVAALQAAARQWEPVELMQCGHPGASVVTGEEGTQFCYMCHMEKQVAALRAELAALKAAGRWQPVDVEDIDCVCEEDDCTSSMYVEGDFVSITAATGFVLSIVLPDNIRLCRRTDDAARDAAEDGAQ